MTESAMRVKSLRQDLVAASVLVPAWDGVNAGRFRGDVRRYRVLPEHYNRLDLGWTS
jgi:hypothetical protein